MYILQTYAFENLARNKYVWEDSPWKGNLNWGGRNAVDGKRYDRSANGGQCVISENGRNEATLGVDLGSVVSISHIDIYYRTENFQMPTSLTERMAGFFLYVSNTTSKDDGHLCFHEIQTVNRTPSEDQRINCSVHGRYVIYYNERRENVTYPSYYSKFAYYEICELEVYGCRDYRRYGDNCNMWCPPNCQERRCDIRTGHCLGCKPGYRGTNCIQTCGAHTYGLGCRSICGNCSRGEACNHVNGRCPGDCDRGVQGEKCKDECQFVNYGENCKNQCSMNCNVTSRCDRFTGSCDKGCKPGWTGYKCDQTCEAGKYGRNCLQNCGHCKERDQCHYVDGFCVEGCSAGFNGSRCIEPCNNNFYGINCSQRCDTSCVNYACHHETGECLTQEQTSNIPTIPILGGSISVLIAVAVIIAVIVIYRRVQCGTRQQQKTEYEDASSTSTSVHHSIQTTVPKLSNIYQNENKVLSKYKGKINEKGDKGIKCKDDDVDIDEKIHEENPYGDFYINEEPLMDIAIEQLWNVIEEKSTNEDDGFKKEYAVDAFIRRKVSMRGWKTSGKYPKEQI